MITVKCPSRRIRIVAMVALAAVAASACGANRGPDFTIGFKRIALDLSYKDEKLSPPPTADVAIPSEVGLLAPGFVAPKFAPNIPKAPGCPVAASDVKPDQPATVFVTKPPALGTYTTHNVGTLSIGAVQPIVLPLPAHGLIQIQNIARSATSDPVNGPTDIITYDVFVPTLDGGTTTTYQVTYSPATATGTVTQQVPGGSHAPQGELDLVHLVVKSSAGTLDFRPQPPVTIMAFKNGEGTSWDSAGTDTVTGTSMVVSGSVSRRTNVDVCGALYDTYEVVSNEHIVNLQTGFRSDTDASDPNVYRVATNLGGLFVQQHIHTTTTATGADGSPVSVGVLYDQTFDSVTPVDAAL